MPLEIPAEKRYIIGTKDKRLIDRKKPQRSDLRECSSIPVDPAYGVSHRQGEYGRERIPEYSGRNEKKER